MTKATKCEDIYDDDNEYIPGAFDFTYGNVDGQQKKVGMAYVCPCGCGLTGFLPFRGYHETHPSWIWDGNEESPSLQPSVHHKINGQTHWHGHLKAGVWESCE